MELKLTYGVRYMCESAVNDLITCGAIGDKILVTYSYNNESHFVDYDTYAPCYPVGVGNSIIQYEDERIYAGNWVRTDIENAPDLGTREYFLHPPIAFNDIVNYRCRESAGYPKYPSGKKHKGVDWANRDGKTKKVIPIRAVDYGTVVRSEKRDDSGNWVQIIHKDGTVTDYMHMYNNSVTVSVDDSVTPGMIIGYLGSTGNSTGDHLHFQRRSEKNFGPAISPYKHIIMFYDINKQISSDSWSIAKQDGKSYSLEELLQL